MFDPWTADVDSVVAAQGATRAAGDAWFGDESPWSPLAQWHAAQVILDVRADIDAGSGIHLVGAVELCLVHHLRAPTWLLDAFSTRTRKVATAEVMSWDDEQALGRPFAKGSHRTAERESRAKAGAIYRAVVDAAWRGVAIDKGLFEEVGESFSLGATRTEEIYRKALAEVGMWDETMSEKNYQSALERLRNWNPDDPAPS
jgi:hypothetical protein